MLCPTLLLGERHGAELARVIHDTGGSDGGVVEWNGGWGEEDAMGYAMFHLRGLLILWGFVIFC